MFNIFKRKSKVEIKPGDIFILNKDEKNPFKHTCNHYVEVKAVSNSYINYKTLYPDNPEIINPTFGQNDSMSESNFRFCYKLFKGKIK